MNVVIKIDDVEVLGTVTINGKIYSTKNSPSPITVFDNFFEDLLKKYPNITREHLNYMEDRIKFWNLVDEEKERES